MVAQSLFYALAIGFFVLVSNSNAAEGESHTVMYFKRSGNQIHVVPRNMMGDDWKPQEQKTETPEAHEPPSKRSDSDDMYSKPQEGSDLLANTLTGAFEALPPLPLDKGDDDDGKVENHIPGYKENPLKDSVGGAIIDAWSKVIGDCDHNSSIDPTATTACKHPATAGSEE